jgi:hypothetical protein
MIVFKRADGWYWRARLAGRQQEGGQVASRSLAWAEAMSWLISQTNAREGHSVAQGGK